MLTSPESAHIARPDGIGDDVPQRWLELANANCGNAFACRSGGWNSPTRTAATRSRQNAHG